MAAECSRISSLRLPLALRISAKMTPLILILIHCLVAVDGAAYPAPTPAARLEERQVFGISTVWSPTVVGTTVWCAFRSSN
jgi:hypothetical protein